MVHAGRHALLQQLAVVEDFHVLALPGVQQVPALCEGRKTRVVEFGQHAGQAAQERRHQGIALHLRQPRHGRNAAPDLPFQRIGHQQIDAAADDGPYAAIGCLLRLDEDAGQFVAILEQVIRPFQLHRHAQRRHAFGQGHADGQWQADQLMQRPLEAPGQREHQAGVRLRHPRPPGAPAAGRLLAGDAQGGTGQGGAARQQVGVGRSRFVDHFDGHVGGARGAMGGDGRAVQV